MTGTQGVTTTARKRTMPGKKYRGKERAETAQENANPFVRPVTTVEAEPDLDRSPILGDQLMMMGATHMVSHDHEPGNDVPGAAPDAGHLNLIGASGGVGVSTIADVCSDRVIDTGEMDPVEGAAGVVVAAVTRHSLRAAEQLRVDDAANTLRGLILVHRRRHEDVSAETRSYAKRVARLYPRSFEVRYERRWPDSTGPVTASWAHKRRFTYLVKSLNAWADPTPPTEKE